MAQQSEILRNVGLFLLHSVFAIMGPAIVDASLHDVIPAHSGTAIILKAWIGSVACAVLTALFMVRALYSRTALWVWVLPGLWLILGIMSWYGTHHGSILEDTLLGRFSGNTCAITLDRRSCRDFLLFTIPFIRAAAYSVGSFLSVVLRRNDKDPQTIPAAQEGAGV